ncbi:hypothetical protein ACQ143_02400 [Microbacterium sp. MC2]
MAHTPTDLLAPIDSHAAAATRRARLAAASWAPANAPAALTEAAR